MQTFRQPRYAAVCRRTALALALGMSLAGTAMAQSNASGVIFGRSAEAGSTIHIENLDTGFARDIGVDADGRYRAASLPVGRYKVIVQKDGNTRESRDNRQVALGGGVDVSFTGAATAAAGNAQTLEGIQVIGNALPAIDVSAVDSRTVLTSEQLQKLPLARNVTSSCSRSNSSWSNETSSSPR